MPAAACRQATDTVPCCLRPHTPQPSGIKCHTAITSCSTGACSRQTSSSCCTELPAWPACFKVCTEQASSKITDDTKAASYQLCLPTTCTGLPRKGMLSEPPASVHAGTRPLCCNNNTRPCWPILQGLESPEVAVVEVGRPHSSSHRTAKCKSFPVDRTLFSSRPGLKLLHAAWHPGEIPPAHLCHGAAD